MMNPFPYGKAFQLFYQWSLCFVMESVEFGSYDYANGLITRFWVEINERTRTRKRADKRIGCGTRWVGSELE